MKAKVGSQVLAVLAVTGLLAAVAHAGHGQGGPTTFVFDCFQINGASPNRIVTLSDPFGGERANIRLNGSQLVCTPAIATKREVLPPALPDPDFDNVPTADKDGNPLDQDNSKRHAASAKASGHGRAALRSYHRRDGSRDGRGGRHRQSQRPGTCARRRQNWAVTAA